MDEYKNLHWHFFGAVVFALALLAIGAYTENKNVHKTTYKFEGTVTVIETK